MYNLFLIFIALGLVLLNAFFVAAEFGMVKLRQTRVETICKSYGLRGKILARVHQQLDAYLSACQVGITLASLGLGWVGEPAFAYLLEPLLQWFGMNSAELIKVIAFVVAFALISFLHIVAGELMPKSWAIRQSEVVSLWTALPLYGFYWLMYPVIWLLNSCSNFFLRRAGLDESQHKAYSYTSEELKLILNASHAHGDLTKAESDIIEHTLDLADLNVTEVMRPQDEMIALDLTQPKQELLKNVLIHRYSRYPVYIKNKQEISGIIHVKDLFAVLYQEREIIDVTSLVRPILKVSHQLPALDLLHKFREGMPHFALVYSDMNALIGFITLDNLLHVLFGRITDEFHKTQDDWLINADGSILLHGNYSLYVVESALGYTLNLSKTETEINTLIGLIFARLGYLPKLGERVSLDDFDFMIQKIQGAKILEVILYPKSTV